MNWALAIVGALGGSSGIAGLLMWRIVVRQNRASASKTEAEAAQIVQSAALELIQPLQAALAALRVDVDTLQKKATEDRRRITDLETDRTTLAEAVHEQMLWQEAGAAPPPPMFSARVRALIATLHTTT